MKVSWIKSKNDEKSFKVPQSLGFNVISIENNEKIDETIDNLISKKCDTIVISNELAGFSQKINNEYLKMKNIDIIISKDKYYKA